LLNTGRFTLDIVDNSRFYQMPKFLFEGKLKHALSNESKILYSLLKDRHDLSLKNRWVNENNEIYLIFTRDEMADMLACSKLTLRKTIDQLKQFNLIEEERLGLNKANRIYLKQLLNADFSLYERRVKFSPSRRLISNLQEGEKLTPSDTNINDTDLNDIKDTFVLEHEHFCPQQSQENINITNDTTVLQIQVDNADNDIKPAVVTDPIFEMFWSIYPKKMEKQKSYRMWKARLKEGLTQEDLLAAANNYTNACRNQNTDQKFIKYPATFLGPDKFFAEWIKLKGDSAYIENNTISAEKGKDNSGLYKKVDFVKFPQHQYSEDDLNRLFEPIL